MLGLVLTVSVALAEFSVIGYLPEWRYLQWTQEEQQYRWQALSRHLSHLIIFSIEVAADGSLAAMDRFPQDSTLRYAHEASKNGMSLLICFGGNSRTNGFPQMVSEKQSRKNFINNLSMLIRSKGLHGVDYNWEYPATHADWVGLSKLVAETREALPDCIITMAYYPDGTQESIIAQLEIDKSLDYLLMMSYDQHQKHSTRQFAERSIALGLKSLPASKLAVGLPFYSRDIRTGHWKTYEDLVKKHGPLDADVDQVGNDYFNGLDTIKYKTRRTQEEGLGGVMLWEVGQDAYSNKDKDLMQSASLLYGISTVTRALDEL